MLGDRRLELDQPVIPLGREDGLERRRASLERVGPVAVADGHAPLGAGTGVRLEVRRHEVGPDQHVVVDEDHHVADGALDAEVARLPGPEPAVLLPGVDEGERPLERLGDLARVVGRAIVADHHASERVALLPGQAGEQRPQALGAAVGGDDDGRSHAQSSNGGEGATRGHPFEARLEIPRVDRLERSSRDTADRDGGSRARAVGARSSGRRQTAGAARQGVDQSRSSAANRGASGSTKSGTSAPTCR